MDNLAEHGIAGMVGLLFNGFFAADYIIGLDGVSTGLINGGFLNHNYKQLYVQLAYGTPTPIPLPPLLPPPLPFLSTAYTH